jgi:hypothetical protein
VQVGNEERIHVYYAHGQDNQTFVRRCYWLLDKYVTIKSSRVSMASKKEKERKKVHVMIDLER